MGKKRVKGQPDGTVPVPESFSPDNKGQVRSQFTGPANQGLSNLAPSSTGWPNNTGPYSMAGSYDITGPSGLCSMAGPNSTWPPPGSEGSETTGWTDPRPPEGQTTGSLDRVNPRGDFGFPVGQMPEYSTTDREGTLPSPPPYATVRLSGSPAHAGQSDGYPGGSGTDLRTNDPHADPYRAGSRVGPKPAPKPASKAVLKSAGLRADAKTPSKATLKTGTRTGKKPGPPVPPRQRSPDVTGMTSPTSPASPTSPTSPAPPPSPAEPESRTTAGSSPPSPPSSSSSPPPPPPPPPPPSKSSGAPGSRRCGRCLKSSVSFVVSTVGLTCLMVGYTVLGGFVFMKLEAPNEVILKSDVQNSRRWHVQRLWNLTYELNVLYPDNWTRLADAILDNYTRKVYVATKNKGWDGKDGESELQWTFAGALLYSITVVTTIGYGHIAPRTTWGRLVTIVYALFGIPLTLLTIANLGGFMATVFRFLYKNVCCGLCCLCCFCCRRRRSGRAPPSSHPAARSAALKYHDPQNGAAGAARALTADDAPGGGAAEAAAAEAGELTPTTRTATSTGNSAAEAEVAKKRSIRVVWRNGLRRMLRTEDNKRVSVPITVSVLVLSSYILSGAVLFTLWEPDWDYLIGSYFCFITLTTIGFGDFVPGTSMDSWANQEKLVLCALYLLFGLALIAMCFDLMQEEARNMVRALGVKLGLVDKEKPKESERL